jgi:hypothetical protein
MDLDATCRQLKDRGFIFDVPPPDQPWLWREAYLHDPDGNVICLYHAGDARRNSPWRLPHRGNDGTSPPLLPPCKRSSLGILLAAQHACCDRKVTHQSRETTSEPSRASKSGTTKS